MRTCQNAKLAPSSEHHFCGTKQQRSPPSAFLPGQSFNRGPRRGHNLLMAKAAAEQKCETLYNTRVVVFAHTSSCKKEVGGCSTIATHFIWQAAQPTLCVRPLSKFTLDLCKLTTPRQFTQHNSCRLRGRVVSEYLPASSREKTTFLKCGTRSGPARLFTIYYYHLKLAILAQCRLAAKHEATPVPQQAAKTFQNSIFRIILSSAVNGSCVKSSREEASAE